tara:strand:+ start:887 stop:1222 length:336 start_codon:yes stop_codon:yes gene_type:complete
MNLNHQKINLIKKLIINLMNIKKNQIYFFKKKNFKKLRDIKLNVIIGNNQNRLSIIFNYIFKKKEIFLVFSYHNHIFFRKVIWNSKNFLFFFLNLKYEIVSVIYKKNSNEL